MTVSPSPRILVTISRRWNHWSEVRRVLTDIHAKYPGAVLVHGDCPDGDRTVAGMWRSMGGKDEPWPAAWGTPCTPRCRHKPRTTVEGKPYCPTPGPVRNALMVESNPDLVISFIRNNSKGALGTYHLAKGAGLNCVPPYTYEEAA